MTRKALIDSTKQLAINVNKIGKNGQTLPNAFDVNSIPAIPDVCRYSPDTTMTNAVAEPTITVSTNGCNIAINACATGLFVLTAENAIGAVPSPDSFANIARLNPHSMHIIQPPANAFDETLLLKLMQMYEEHVQCYKYTQQMLLKHIMCTLLELL